MNSTTHITLDPAFRIAPVNRRTFGSFIEHLGRGVYTGIFEPGHPSADERGFRRDVLDLVRELGVTTVRYPGGNFVSGYRWEDGVGPVSSRPRRLDLAWHSTETNQFGVDEFMAWAAEAGVEPMMAVNLGTRGVQEALDLLEYCNVSGGTALSDARRTNGAPDPYNVRMWCLGNEMDGPWQIGAKTAHEYGRLASQTAKAMRMIDPDLELVVCGSSGSSMPTFGEWEREVLTQTYEDVDFISAHAYYQEHDGDLASFLASGVDMDYFIDSVAATCDHVKAARKQTKDISISFDEWNVWYTDEGRVENELVRSTEAKEGVEARSTEHTNEGRVENELTRSTETKEGVEARSTEHQNAAPSKTPTGDNWPVAPHLLENHYSVTDAVVVGGLLICLLRHSDRVRSACLAQLVNVIAPIMTEPAGSAWRQTSFHPFCLTARYARGQVLSLDVRSPLTSTKKYGDVPLVDATATWDEETGDVTVFVLNRATDSPSHVEIDCRALGEVRLVQATTIANPDRHWKASVEDSTSMGPHPLEDVVVDAGRLCLNLPPISWSMLRLA